MSKSDKSRNGDFRTNGVKMNIKNNTVETIRIFGIITFPFIVLACFTILAPLSLMIAIIESFFNDDWKEYPPYNNDLIKMLAFSSYWWFIIAIVVLFQI